MNPMYATNLGRHSDIGIMEESYPYCNGFAGFEATQSPEGSGEVSQTQHYRIASRWCSNPYELGVVPQQS